MNSYFHRFLSVTCLMALGMSGRPLFAQQVAQPTQLASPGITAGSTNGPGIGGVIPYTADEVTVTTQTLADGTKITHKRLVKLYRDSQGRLRREWFKAEAESVGQGDSPQLVEINDPVAGAHYNLNPGDRTAQRGRYADRHPPPLIGWLPHRAIFRRRHPSRRDPRSKISARK